MVFDSPGSCKFKSIFFSPSPNGPYM